MTTGYLATLTAAQQIEVAYIAYFGRAADAGGLKYWEQSGLSLPQIAASFALQPEAAPLVAEQPAALIASVYQNLFSHAPDAGGAAYWAAQIASGAVSVGAAVLAIADGAQGGDASVLTYKVGAAGYFTAYGIYAGLTATPPALEVVVSEAHNVVAPVVDFGTMSLSEWGSFAGYHASVPYDFSPSATVLPIQPPNVDGLLLGA